MCKYNFKTYFVFNLHLHTLLSHMMFDKDELHTKVVVLYEIYNFIFQTFLTEIVWISKYVSQDFIELIPKESICSTVISECAVVVNDLGWRRTQNKICRSLKVMQLCSS